MLKQKFLLNTQFFLKDGNDSVVLVPKKPQDVRRPKNSEYSMDILNRQYRVELLDPNRQVIVIYISVYTTEFGKVFEISDEPS